VSREIYYNSGAARDGEGVDIDGYIRHHSEPHGVIVGDIGFKIVGCRKSADNDVDRISFLKSLAILETWLENGEIVVSVKPGTDLDALQEEYTPFHWAPFFPMHNFYKDENGNDWLVSVYQIADDYGGPEWVEKFLQPDPDYFLVSKILDEKKIFVGDKYTYERANILDEEVRKVKRNRWEVAEQTGQEYVDTFDPVSIAKHEPVTVTIASPGTPYEYASPSLEEKFNDSRYLKRKIIWREWDEERYK
jgi:hypothetical protein